MHRTADSEHCRFHAFLNLGLRAHRDALVASLKAQRLPVRRAVSEGPPVRLLTDFGTTNFRFDRCEPSRPGAVE